MTIIEIWQALQLIRNTLIQSHVQMNSAMDQIEKLSESIREQVEQQPSAERK